MDRGYPNFTPHSRSYHFRSRREDESASCIHGLTWWMEIVQGSFEIVGTVRNSSQRDNRKKQINKIASICTSLSARCLGGTALVCFIEVFQPPGIIIPVVAMSSIVESRQCKSLLNSPFGITFQQRVFHNKFQSHRLRRGGILFDGGHCIIGKKRLHIAFPVAVGGK